MVNSQAGLKKVCIDLSLVGCQWFAKEKTVMMHMVHTDFAIR